LIVLLFSGCDNTEEVSSPFKSPFGPKNIPEKVKITFDHIIYAEIEIPDEIKYSENADGSPVTILFKTPLHPEGKVISLVLSELPIEIVNAELKNGILVTRQYGDIEVFVVGLKNGKAIFELRATQDQITSMQKQIVKYLNNKNALFSAVLDDDIPKLKEVINKKPDLNVRSVDNVTPLITATIMNHQNVVQILLEANADVNAKDRAGWTALIHFASSNNDPELGKALIDAKADINAKDKNGTTALIVAAARGNVDFVKVLVEAGADLNAEAKITGEPFTALDAAEREGHMEIVEFLKKSE
jgi:hypothetical protein